MSEWPPQGDLPARSGARYRIVSGICGGGQGRVLLARDRCLERLVAIKLHTLCADARARMRVLQAARLQAGLNSPYITQLHDLRSTRRGMALVLEYVPGCDLQALLRAGALPLHSALLVASEIAAGLAATARQGITHGDLKPANVLVGTDGRVRITDFGVAVHGRGVRARGGSVYALAPEHLTPGRIDPRTDLFLLGLLLHHLVLGRHPFAGTPDWPRALLAAEYAPLSGAALPAAIEAPLAELLRTLLQVDPAARCISPMQARAALLDLRRALPTGARAALVRRVNALPSRLQGVPGMPPQTVLRSGAARSPAAPPARGFSAPQCRQYPPGVKGSHSGSRFPSAGPVPHPAAWKSDCSPSH